MFRTLVSLFNLNFKKESKVLLGRWNREDCSKTKNIWANYDHCSSSVCRDPKELKKLIIKQK